MCRVCGHGGCCRCFEIHLSLSANRSSLTDTNLSEKRKRKTQTNRSSSQIVACRAVVDRLPLSPAPSSLETRATEYAEGPACSLRLASVRPNIPASTRPLSDPRTSPRVDPLSATTDSLRNPSNREQRQGKVWRA